MKKRLKRSPPASVEGRYRLHAAGNPSIRGLMIQLRPQHARSASDGLGMLEKAAVWGAARTGSQTFMRQRQGNVALTGAHGGLGQGPVDDVALRVAARGPP